MQLFEINSRFMGSVLFSLETESLKLAVEAGVAAGADLSMANLSRANLHGANLSRANLYGANLYGADLSMANLYGANLYGANLSRANLHGANLYGANLYGADLSRANLHGANLSRANLYGADLSMADLYGANLYGANLSRANLHGANLSRANLYGADLSGAKIAEDITIEKIPINIYGAIWNITIWDSHMQIGCEFHALAEWFEFDDARISHMETRALTFWNQWKGPLMQICVANDRYTTETPA